MPSWRYLAQRSTTGHWLDMHLPLTRDTLRWDLSGPGQLQGKISPEIARLRGPDGLPLLREWDTYIYAEADGQIRWGGIYYDGGFAGADWQLDCMGFSGFPAGQPYTGAVYTRRTFDPSIIFTDLWAWLQSTPQRNLGLTVTRPTTIPVRVGTVEEPYTLTPWEAKDIGQELDTLTRETPWDWLETHSWSGTPSAPTVAHNITIGYPRVGRRRTDLSFVQGANIIGEPVYAKRPGATYANAIYGIGKGEGAATIQAPVAVNDGRLLRTAVYSDKTAATTARLQSLGRDEIGRRSLEPAISEIRVKDHPNARLWSWQLGDDVPVRANMPWLGWTEVWSRIIGWTLISETEATLNLARSDSFAYGIPQ